MRSSIHTLRDTIAGLALAASATATAHALSLGEMAAKAAADLDRVPVFIAIIFYILGVLIFGFGLIRLKKHVDHPAQTTLGSGIIALLIGVALLVTPAAINGVADMFGADATDTLTRPSLD